MNFPARISPVPRATRGVTAYTPQERVDTIFVNMVARLMDVFDTSQQIISIAE